ncbi:hypothetical protein OSTOST_02091, partial [Ostertagia ostertagi]
SSSAVNKSSKELSRRVVSENARTRPETRAYLHARQSSAKSAFTDVAHGISTPSPSPSTAHLSTHFSSEPAIIDAMSPDDEVVNSTVLVGQPSERAVMVPDLALPRLPQIPTVLAASPWTYSQSEISTQPTTLATHSSVLARGTSVESDTFRSEAVPFDPIMKRIHMEPSVVSRATAESVLEEQQLLSLPCSENSKAVVYQKKSRQPSGSQELWEPLGIKSPTYGVILPVASKNDNDADDATVAFLTSSPELLSEDDSCAVKEEIDEQQAGLMLKGASPSRVLRQRFRSATKLTSESSDTDQRTVIDLEEDQAECRSSDRDGDIQKLSNELAALSQLSEHEHLDSGMNSEPETMGNLVPFKDHSEERKSEHTSPSVSRQALGSAEKSDSVAGNSSSLVEAVNSPILVDSQDFSLSRHIECCQTEVAGKVLAGSAAEGSAMQNIPRVELGGDCASEQQTMSRTTAMPTEICGGMPISVIISSRTEKSNEEIPLATRKSHQGRAVGATAGVEVRQSGEENLYDEDYSADDEELVHFHEESERSYQEMMQQQSQYEQPLMHQQQPSSIIPTAEFHNLASFKPKTFTYEPRHEQIFPAWLSHTAVTRPESPQLKIQTVFENTHHITSHHSDPALQPAVVSAASGPVAPNIGSLAATQPSQFHQQAPPPHTFPLQRCQTQRNDSVQYIELQQQKQHKDPYSERSGGTDRTWLEVRAQKDVYAARDLTSLQQQFRRPLQQSQQFTNKPLEEILEAPSDYHLPTHTAPPPQPRRFHHDQVTLEQHSHNQYPIQKQHSVHEESERVASHQRHPAELMEEEMRAMRYVYLMNEQRIAKKALAEKDKIAAKKRTSSSDLMFLPELPPIMVEPTVIPEGIPRARMQEHLLPPYYHAQFAVRRGLCVSPCRSDTSENELTKAQEILNLEIFEPMASRAGVQRVQTEIRQGPDQERCQNVSYEVPPTDLLRQQHASGDSIRSECFHSPKRSDTLAPEFQKFHDPQPAVATRSQSFSPLKISIPQRPDVPRSSKEADLSSNEEDSDATDDEMWSADEREFDDGSSDDDSTDSEVVRRGWDLSPSVSPLTLEAFTSILSSPEGSDSNDDPIGVPVWSTMSRKHAKLAIAVCRNMPKRLQPLCRRFAWQQGITYLLENFCLQKWEIRPEHDLESVWFFEKLVRRFKPFDIAPWEINDSEESDEEPKRVQNVFFGFNICADIPFSRSRKTFRIEDHASLSLTCKEVQRCDEVSSSDTCSAEGVGKVFKRTSVEETSPAASLCSSVESASTEDEDDECSSDENIQVGERSAVQVTSILAELYREHRAAYELMIADIIPIPTPDQREIPFSDNAEWVASRILAINRAQNRLLIPTFPPWAAMHRLWKVYGPLHQCASAIGGDFEKFVTECVSVAYNHYYRLKNGIKVADEIPGDLLDLCYAITSERMREHTESVEAAKKKADGEAKPSKTWTPLKRREGLCSFSDQRTANARLLSRCHRVYDEKRQTRRRRWNAMRYLHNALPGCVIEGIDVFDMAQRTNLSVAGIFGPEHKLALTEMPFASDMDNRPAYLDMEELLGLMDRTLALQSGSTVDQEGNKQPTIDFLTVNGLHFKATTGERGRCHLMVSPAAIPVPPVVIDGYGNVTAVQRAAVPKLLYPEFAYRKMYNVAENVYPRSLDSPLPRGNEDAYDPVAHCPMCLRTSDYYADMDFVRMCFKGLPQEVLEDFELPDVDTSCTTYHRSRIAPQIMTEEDLNKLLNGE